MPTGTTPYDTVSAITSRFRALVGDQDGDVFPDSKWGTGTNGDTKEYINHAYRQVALKLANNASGTMTEDDFEQVIPAGTFQLVFGGAPGLPGDLLVPLRLWEKSTDGSDYWSQMAYMNVAMIDQPIGDVGSTLQYWRWVTDAIEFPPGGASQDRMLKMQYTRTLSAFLNLTDQDAIIAAVECIANYAVYYAAKARVGATPSSASFKQDGDEYLEELENVIVRAQQSRTFRRKPYGRRPRLIFL